MYCRTSISITAQHLLFSVVIIGLFSGCGSSSNSLQAQLAVYDGLIWHKLYNGNHVTVYRDNPPLSGKVDIRPGKVQSRPVRDTDVLGLHFVRGVFAQGYLWSNIDIRIDGANNWTYRDKRNADGYLGVAPVGKPMELANQDPSSLRWHSNGLLLQPNVPIALQLQRRKFVVEGNAGRWIWESAPGAQGTVVLHESTIIVGVTVAVVTEPGNRPPSGVDEALAQLWFDGRAVDRLSTFVGASQPDPRDAPEMALSTYISDRDPRPFWNEASTDPNQGKYDNRGQEVDAVWCYCGVHYGKNIQFRLVRYVEISSDIAPGCANIATADVRYQTQLRSCVGRWADEVRRAGGSAGVQPTVPVFIVQTLASSPGNAEAWREGIVIGLPAFTANPNTSYHPETVLAHELAHFLGWNSPLGEGPLEHSGAPRDTLPDTGEPRLTRSQCDAAYEAARLFAIR
jgi:hypothetical protein